MFENNNKQNQVNTNTTLVSWYSNEAKLVIGAWNEKLSLKFTPCTGKTPDGLNIFDREKEIVTSLTPEKALTLYRAIEEVIMPHIVAGDSEEVNVMVSMGTSEAPNALVIERKKNSEDKLSIFITFLKGLNPDGKGGDATKIVSYECKDVEYMTNYDFMTGSGDTKSMQYGQFSVFVEMIRNVIKLLPMEYHSEKHSKAISKMYSSRYGNQSAGGSSSASDFGNFMSGGMEELPFQ